MKIKTSVFIILCPIFNISFSQSPAIEWQNDIGGNSYDHLYCVTHTADGGCILGGASESGISFDKTEASLGNYDYWVVKLNV